MLAGMTVGLWSLITKHFASGIGITLCSRRKSISSTTSKSSMRTTTRSNSPVQAPNLKGTLLETPTIGKASEGKVNRTVCGGLYTTGIVKVSSGSSFEGKVLKMSPLGYFEEVYLSTHLVCRYFRLAY